MQLLEPDWQDSGRSISVSYDIKFSCLILLFFFGIRVTKKVNASSLSCYMDNRTVVHPSHLQRRSENVFFFFKKKKKQEREIILVSCEKEREGKKKIKFYYFLKKNEPTCREKKSKSNNDSEIERKSTSQGKLFIPFSPCFFFFSSICRPNSLESQIQRE